MPDFGPASHFFNDIMPRLVAAGRLVVLCRPSLQVMMRATPTAPDLMLFRIGRDNELFSNAVHTALMLDGSAGDSLKNAAKSARFALDNPLAWHHLPDHTVDSVYYTPTLICLGGRYHPVPRGHCPALRTFSLCDPLEPAPSTGTLDFFLDLLNLQGTNRLRVLAFYAGCLIRACFGPMPGLLVRSPYKGTGKTTIARGAAAMFLGSPHPQPMSWKGQVEFNKELGAVATRAPLFFIDNVKTDDLRHRFRSDTVCAAISSGCMTTRLLGHSQMVSIDRPVFIVTMQDSTIDQDLADRFLTVNLTDRPPGPGSEDVARLLSDHWQDMRADLLNLLLQTTPDSQSSLLRYGDFFRHLAPVLRLATQDNTPQRWAGRSDDALDLHDTSHARADLLELLQLLARHCEASPDAYLDPSSLLLEEHYAHRWPALAATVPESLPRTARHATLSALCRELPTTYDAPEHRYILLTREGRGGKIEYRVETHPRD